MNDMKYVIPAPLVTRAPLPVIPAQAGIQGVEDTRGARALGPRLRGDDEEMRGDDEEVRGDDDKKEEPHHG